MQDIKLGFDSVTYAMRARELLVKQGISAEVTRKSKPDKAGCAFALTLAQNQKAAAEALLSNAGIRYTRTQ